MAEIFPIFCQPAAAPEPADCAFDDPSFGQNDEAFGSIGTADNLGDETRQDARQSIMEHRPGIGAVGKQLLEERELSEHGGQEHQPTVAILNIGGCNQSMQQQAERIDKDMALLAFDQLACIEAMGIDAGPPFSALFTLWLSMMPAVGLTSRSACSRHLT